MAKKSLRKAGRSNSTAGYGRPPVASRWKKGMSGNPSGRPRGSRNLKSMIRKRLLAQVTVHENGKARKITSLEALLAKALNEALLGRPKAFIDVCKFLQSAALFFSKTSRKTRLSNIQARSRSKSFDRSPGLVIRTIGHWTRGRRRSGPRKNPASEPTCVCLTRAV